MPICHHKFFPCVNFRKSDGRKMQKKQEEQQQQIEAYKQNVTMLVIDKKIMKLKEAGLP